MLCFITNSCENYEQYFLLFPYLEFVSCLYSSCGNVADNKQHQSDRKRRYLYPAILCWLLLLPNAPYLITDFLHLKKEGGVPVWFDVLLLISFTLNGLLFGLASMKNMYNILTIKFSRFAASVSMSLTCLLCGFGMYVGRFLRYNSWDILNRPINLTADIFDSLFSADTYRAAWGITFGFGMLMYLLFSLYNSDNEN